jgi:hydroxyacylglutathione hydrolase
MRKPAILVLLFSFLCVTQTEGAGQTPAPSTTGAASSNRPRPTDGIPRATYLTGKVRVGTEGRSPTERVAIERVCNSVVHREGFTDSRGDFSLQVGVQSPSGLLDASVGFERVPPATEQGLGLQAGLSDRGLAGCEIRANIAGYRSDSITLGFRRALDDPFIGVLYIYPLPRGDESNAAKADLHFYQAVAHQNSKNVAAAEVEAREAAKLDVDHRNPKINLLLGVILTEAGNYREAAENLRLYLKLVPGSSEAGSIREQVAALEKASANLNVKWIHGSEPCAGNKDVPFQVHAYGEDTFILRENKCINYEAPFIYLLFGNDKVFMQDTGAAPRADSGIAFPIRETVQSIVDDWSRKHGKTGMQLVVTHSHAHGDHTGGDSQFAGQANTTLVGTKVEDVQSFFGIKDWPSQQVTLDLGGRILDIIPIPGHDATSLAVYDRKTKILLTGDTVYPGRLYIRDWPVFKASIERLAIFVKTHEVSHVLGAHIEMSNKPGVDYPVRTTYQPEEHDLALTPTHILELNEAISRMLDGPVREIHNDFIVYPR